MNGEQITESIENLEQVAQRDLRHIQRNQQYKKYKKFKQDVDNGFLTIAAKINKLDTSKNEEND